MSTNKIKLTIARNLKEARRSKGLTQVEVADKTDINVSHYAKIERGEIMPTVITLYKILKAIKVDSSKVLPF